MKISGDWLNRPDTQRLCRLLEDAGFQALFVGGCVRNALIGAPVADIDIATDATPDLVTNIARKGHFKVIPTGIDHGTVTVIAGGIVHEITTFRRDVETDGRHATVAFSTSLIEDASRRDFTMNALYARRDGNVVDPLSGLEDLQARRLRFVGDAQQRIREDYLRILRFFRFHAWYGDAEAGLDAEGYAACAALSAGIETLSKERIGSEMRKLLSAPDPSPAVAAMAQAGILARVLPGAEATALPVLVHFGATDWIARLSVLGGAEVAENLRLSKAEARKLATCREELGSLRGPAELAYRFGSALARDIVLARAAIFTTPPPEDLEQRLAIGEGAKLPVRPIDLMPAFTGAALGDELRRMEARWIASGFKLTRAELMR
jgi:poly(A) polymerase